MMFKVLWEPYKGSEELCLSPGDEAKASLSRCCWSFPGEKGGRGSSIPRGQAQVWIKRGMLEEPGAKGVTAVLEGEDDLCALSQRS